MKKRTGIYLHFVNIMYMISKNRDIIFLILYFFFFSSQPTWRHKITKCRSVTKSLTWLRIFGNRWHKTFFGRKTQNVNQTERSSWLIIGLDNETWWSAGTSTDSNVSAGTDNNGCLTFLTADHLNKLLAKWLLFVNSEESIEDKRKGRKALRGRRDLRPGKEQADKRRYFVISAVKCQEGRTDRREDGQVGQSSSAGVRVSVGRGRKVSH